MTPGWPLAQLSVIQNSSITPRPPIIMAAPSLSVMDMPNFTNGKVAQLFIPPMGAEAQSPAKWIKTIFFGWRKIHPLGFANSHFPKSNYEEYQPAAWVSRCHSYCERWVQQV